MKTKINTLFITFDYPLQHHQLHDFRSQFKELKSLVYNRDEKGKNIYGYPSIQFRVNEGNASVFAINDGVNLIEKLVKKRSLPVIGKVINHEFPLKKLETINAHFYRLIRWIPLDERYFPILTSDEIQEYNSSLFESADTNILISKDGNGNLNNIGNKESIYGEYKKNKIKPWNDMFMDEKVSVLEKILVSNILEFAQGTGWTISKNKSLRVRLHNIHHINTVNLYDKKVLSFDVTYSANVTLPDQLGLGRGKSLGFGWQILSEHNDDLKRLLATRIRSKAKVL
jgi:hypothetical protein